MKKFLRKFSRNRYIALLMAVLVMVLSGTARAQTAPEDATEFIEAAAATVSGFAGPVITVGLALVSIAAIWAGIKIGRRALAKA